LLVDEVYFGCGFKEGDVDLVVGLTRSREERERDPCARGRRHSGLKLKELGEAMGGMDYSAVSGGIIRFEKKLTKNSEL